MSSCILCGHTKTRELYRGTDRLYQTTSEVFQVVACTGCGLARLNPFPADLAGCYPPGYWLADNTASVYRKLVLRDHAHFVRQGLAPGSRVLDVGSGGGLLSAMLREQGACAVALDLSPVAAAVANRAGARAIAADFAHPPFAEASWDSVAMFHVLEHVPDPRAHLRAAHRLLKPGGRLVIAVPAFDSFQRALFGTRWTGMDIPRHLHHFRERDLRALLQTCGFTVDRVRRFSWRDSAAGLASTLAPNLDPMSRIARGGTAGLLPYAALTAAALPLAALEATFGKGAIMMLRAFPNRDRQGAVPFRDPTQSPATIVPL